MEEKCRQTRKVIKHLEQVEWPRLRIAIQSFILPRTAKQTADHEKETQQIRGSKLLKTPYA